MKSIIKAPAKINLCLRVNGIREDGYHNLSMIMQTISLFDTLEFEIIKENDFNFDFISKLKNKKLNCNTNQQINLACNQAFLPLQAPSRRS